MVDSLVKPKPYGKALLPNVSWAMLEQLDVDLATTGAR